MKLEVRRMKSQTTRRGVAYTCDLHVDGQLVAACEHDGDGGAMCYRFFDPEVEQTVRAWVAANPHEGMQVTDFYEGEELDCYVALLCDDYETDRKLKRACKARTVFRTAETPLGEWDVRRVLYTPAVRAQILAQHPTAVFANDRFGGAAS